MVTPYDWQEGMGNRAQYVEMRLAQGIPVIAKSVEEGLVVATFRKTTPKVYDLYEGLVFAAVGLQADMESLRVAAIDFAHREGYSRSEEDVTGQRVVTALSTPLKRAFGDFNSAPFVFRGLVGEVGEERKDDRVYLLDYDGDYTMYECQGVLAGDEDTVRKLVEATKGTPETAADAAKFLVAEIQKVLAERDVPMQSLHPEAALVERSTARENRFRSLDVT